MTSNDLDMVGLGIPYVGHNNAYEGDIISYVGLSKSYVGLLFFFTCGTNTPSYTTKLIDNMYSLFTKANVSAGILYDDIYDHLPVFLLGYPIPKPQTRTLLYSSIEN